MGALDGPELFADDAEIVAWKAKALCRGLPIDLFFPSGGDLKQGREICEKCSVITQCLEYGNAIEVETGFRCGVYGGTGPKARDKKFGSLVHQRAVNYAEG